MGSQHQFQVARIRALPLQMVNTKCLGRLEKQSGFGHISFLYSLELAQNQIAELLRQSSRVRDRLQFGAATSLWGDRSVFVQNEALVYMYRSVGDYYQTNRLIVLFSD